MLVRQEILSKKQYLLVFKADWSQGLETSACCLYCEEGIPPGMSFIYGKVFVDGFPMIAGTNLWLEHHRACGANYPCDYWFITLTLLSHYAGGAPRHYSRIRDARIL